MTNCSDGGYHGAKQRWEDLQQSTVHSRRKQQLVDRVERAMERKQEGPSVSATDGQ